MFKNITDFSLKRTNIQALGFYISWVLFILILAIFLASLIEVLLGSDAMDKGRFFDIGMRMGVITAIFVSVVSTFLVIKAKNKLKDFSSLIFIILSGILAFLGGAILGMIIPSVLTTKDIKQI